MADCRCVHVLTFCVFTQIFLLCVAQNTHMRNVAQNKPCGISSMYTSYSNNCSAALNGNKNTFYQDNPPNCIHTADNDTSPFWWVDLGEKVTISMITIYGRKAFRSRMPCVNVSVDGALVKRFTDVTGWTNDTYTILMPRSGRVVNITKDGECNEPTINICEVQVWVCDDGWYEDCTKSCGQCNNNIACDKVDGRCTSCQTGFQPPLCQECLDGLYGTDCSLTCGNCISSSVCNKMTGRCTSCQTGFNPPYCKECADGWYGSHCSQTCGNCISSSDCNKTTGRCTSCQTGFKLPYCRDCEKGWYGHNCVQTCGHCEGGNSVCDKINGSCPSCAWAYKPPLCKDNCEKGWYGHNCNQTCGHCVGGNSVCDKINGSCLSCDGAFKPPLCKDHCEKGWYGHNCNEMCGRCEGGNSVCDKVNGSCPSCAGAFKPPLCKDNCEKGWYGHNCAETCGHCVGGNSTCDKINGSCPSCAGAFKPPLCKDNLFSEPLITTLNTLSSVQATVTEYSSKVGMSCDNDKETVSVAGPVAGAAVGCAVVFFIIGAIFGWWLRKSRSQQPSARGPSPHEIPMTSDAGTSRSTSRPDDKVDNTSDYTNIGNSTNIYDALKVPDDNNTAAYTSLDFHTHTDAHR